MQALLEGLDVCRQYWQRTSGLKLHLLYAGIGRMETFLWKPNSEAELEYSSDMDDDDEGGEEVQEILGDLLGAVEGKREGSWAPGPLGQSPPSPPPATTAAAAANRAADRISQRMHT